MLDIVPSNRFKKDLIDVVNLPKSVLARDIGRFTTMIYHDPTGGNYPSIAAIPAFFRNFLIDSSHSLSTLLSSVNCP